MSNNSTGKNTSNGKSTSKCACHQPCDGIQELQQVLAHGLRHERQSLEGGLAIPPVLFGLEAHRRGSVRRVPWSSFPFLHGQVGQGGAVGDLALQQGADLVRQAIVALDVGDSQPCDVCLPLGLLLAPDGFTI